MKIYTFENTNMKDIYDRTEPLINSDINSKK